MDEMDGVLLLCHSVMSSVTGACVPSALPELLRGERQSQAQGNVLLYIHLEEVGWKRRVQNIFNTNMKSIETSKGGMKDDVRAMRGK